MTTVKQEQAAGMEAKKRLLALAPPEKRDYADALIEEIITRRFSAAQAGKMTNTKTEVLISTNCGCSCVTGACTEHKWQNALVSEVAEAMSEADEVRPERSLRYES